MKRVKQFGETVEGYNIPVLNEREIRASAGILYLLMFWSWILVIFNDNYLLLKYANTIFLADFIVRIFISPKYSPLLIIGRLIVSNQTPEYVGAAQKKFAWTIGVVLAATMLFFFIIANAYSPITGITCLICLIFLFFESAFGICLGCKFYPLFFKDKTQYCPGEVCNVNQKQDIQKTSKIQFLILLAFIAFILLTVYLMNDRFIIKPNDLMGINNTEQTKKQ